MNPGPQLPQFQPATLRTLEMIGRDRFLADAVKNATLGDLNQPRIVFIVGRGGAGKTMRLQTLLPLDASDDRSHILGSGALSARGLVDLYHVVHHTAIGLATAIRDTLSEIGDENAFKAFDRELRELNKRRQSNRAEGISQQRDIVLKAFEADMASLSRSGPVVLALDTAERLAYAAQSGLRHIGHCWEWLLSSLPRWGNVVLFIAGRAPSLVLMRQLQDVFEAAGANRNVNRLDISAFDEAETDAYFQAVAHILRREGQLGHAKRVEAMTPDMRRAAHACSMGVPILLALIVDALRSHDVPDMLRLSAAQVEAMPPAERDEAQAKLESQLIGRLVFGESDEAQTIIALGRAPRGVDEQLLARLLGLSSAEAAQRLNAVKRYSFVKCRDGDARVFLHDEMYALLGRYYYNAEEDDRASKPAQAAIHEHYQEQLQSLKQQLDKIFAPAEEHNRADIDLDVLFTLQAHRSASLTDDLYYRLRRDAADGFRQYYRYMREATLSSDTTLDAQLEAEVSAFLMDPGVKVDEVTRREFESVLRVRPMARAWSEKRYDDTIALGASLLREQADWLGRDANARAAVQAYVAYAHTYLAGPDHLTQARQDINEVVAFIGNHLETYPEPLGNYRSSTALWRTGAIQAFAYHVRGYLNRVQGRMRDAVEDYQRAGALWHEVHIKVEQARVLNDMGFAMSEMGDWPNARGNVREALRLRQQLGHRAAVALSFNTLGLVELRAGNYQAALGYSQTALTLARALGYRQGEGLALIALSEELRRLADQESVSNDEEKVDRLREAISYADEALEIFDDTQEVPRQVEALIEKGCAYRNWAHLRKATPSPKETVDRLARLSNEALLDAAKRAGPGILYRLLDAHVNRVVLAYYAGRKELYESARRDAESVISQYAREYTISETTGKPGILPQDAQPNLWLQFGKLYTVYGHFHFEATKAGASEMEQVVSNYLLGLEYDALFSENSISDQQAKDQVVTHIRGFTLDQQRAAVQWVGQLEKKWHLQSSRLQQLLRKRTLWFGP